MPLRAVPDRFLVAFSFSGAERGLIEPLATALEQRLGEGTVFYDDWYQHYIAGLDGDLRLQKVYAELSELVVIGVSGSYGSKAWPLAEYDAVRARAMKLRASTDDRDAYRILPLRVGEGEVEGMYGNNINLDIRKRPLAETVDLVLNRLRLACPATAAPAQAVAEPVAARHVFLAECTADLDDATRPVNRSAVKNLLQELGWTVLQPAEDEAASYEAALRRDLARSEAYVQLLGPVPWKRGNYDRLQFDAAEASGLPRFVFRSDQIDLALVQPEAHREWLRRPDLIVSSFDDFLVSLRKQLGPPKAAAVARGSQDETPPMVRVDIRSANRDALWERVFQWIYLEQGMVSDLLAPDESFAAKQLSDPCQGFLIVCDAQAMEEGPQSPREAMVQCRQIQIGVKDATRRPPVALVYWPPPEPSWARLLKTMPPKLHRAQAGNGERVPPEVTQFFDDVRRAAG